VVAPRGLPPEELEKRRTRAGELRNEASRGDARQDHPRKIEKFYKEKCLLDRPSSAPDASDRPDEINAAVA